MELTVRFDDVTKHIEVEMPGDAPDNFVIACATALSVQACKMAGDEDKAMIRAAGLFDVVTSIIRNGTIEDVKEDKKQNFRAKGKQKQAEKPQKPKRPNFNADATSQMIHTGPKTPHNGEPINEDMLEEFFAAVNEAAGKKAKEMVTKPAGKEKNNKTPKKTEETKINTEDTDDTKESEEPLLADYPDSVDEDPFADFY